MIAQLRGNIFLKVGNTGFMVPLFEDRAQHALKELSAYLGFNRVDDFNCALREERERIWLRLEPT